MPETAGSQHIDYRISMYQPMAYVKLHRHKVQEQVYHVLEGEGLMEIDGENHVVRKHDYIFLPPGVDHSIATPAWSTGFWCHLAGDGRVQLVRILVGDSCAGRPMATGVTSSRTSVRAEV